MRRLIGTFLGNLAGIALASSIVPGFLVTPRSSALLLAAILTALHLTLKPFLKFLAWPLVALTLGLGLLAINGIVLALLDFISENLTIRGLEPLAFGTLLLWGTNVLVHLFVRAIPHKD